MLSDCILVNIPKKFVGTFNDGVAAGRQGLPYSVNTHTDKRFRDMWRDGYYCGQTFLRVIVRGY